ncbi:efflux RND transporter permease subunit [Luteolibacter marinus]|uniref:efflux RND transporter permease subunit n=1 Tax=Luteolibacter marinus TaxID=2776705 RepID=UPI001865CA97|nr:efflux RND transporter permease subunit [Luteolibacter marinus]
MSERDDPIRDHPFIAWFAGNPVVANVLLLTILAAGIYTAMNIRKEAFPAFDAESVTIEVPFLGGTPEDVERGVTIKIEEALQGVQGIDHVRSESRDNGATITVEAIEKYPVQKLLDDVKIKVDAIPSFPVQVENPIIRENKRRNPVMWIEVHGSASEAVLKETARNLRDELLKLREVSLVDTYNARNYEISVEVSESKLRAFGLTFGEVADAVSNNSIDLAGGVVRSEGGEITLRSRNQAYRLAEFGAIPVRTAADGTRIFLRDVAEIRDAFVDQEILGRFDGEPSVALQVATEGNDDVIDASVAARALAERYPVEHPLPDGVTVTHWNDGSKPIRGRLELLTSNGLFGTLLVIVSLALFLNLRLAFWVAVGIPFSIAGAIMLFPVPGIGLSINQLTSFAFIIVLGILVDDAIVIGESVFSAKEEQKHPEAADAELRSTVRGVAKVIVPAFFGVVTTIAAFLPLTQISGRLGSVLGQTAVVVILALIFSLIESKLILPSHLAHIDVHRRGRNIFSRALYAFQDAVAAGLQRFVRRFYLPVLRWLMGYRYLVAAAFLALLIVVIGLIPAGKLRFVFFPDIFRDDISANIELEQGLPVDYLHETAERVGRGLVEAARELEAESGDKILVHHQIAASTNTKAAIAAELTPSESRVTSTGDVVRRWREKVGPVAGARALVFTGTAGGRNRPDFDIQLESPDLEALRIAADDLKAKVATFPGTNDVKDTFDSGKPEIRIAITPEGEAAGFTRRDLALNVRDAFYGREAQRVQRGRDEVKVMVRYPIEERGKLETLRDMRIRAADGTAVPFSVVADTDYSSGLASIQRADSNRTVNVQANVDKSVTSGEEILSRLSDDYFPAFRAQHPGVNIALLGEAEQRARSISSLLKGFGISLISIYILLAIPLKSYTKPLAIMSVIPFGIIGALLGHFLFGLPVSILSVFGLLALSGIVVNDSLVLVHRVDELRAEGLPLADALHDAGGQRFRAILLTTLTTFVGLVPLLAETAVQAQFLKPMAVSVGFGVVFATVITLVLLPMLILISHDFRVRFRRSLEAWKGLRRGDAAVRE